jgi:POT family proton-dependent oligopeptide transporter
MSQTLAQAPVPAPPRQLVGPGKDILGHPRGLVVLAGTEFWDRVSFYGMQALLTLYMVEQLLLPGHVEHVVGFGPFRAAIESVTGPLSAQALAFQVFGLYIGLVNMTPLLGGVLGDRLLGRRRTVALGALLMTAGHFCMAFDRSFLLALLLLTVGAGCLRGNIVSQVGALYALHDRRRADAFQIYYAAINTGAFIAPLVSGALGKAYGWHYGFGFAGFGMLAGLLIYLRGQRHLAPDEPRAAARVRTALTAAEWRRVMVLGALTPLVATYWLAQSQVWNVYNVWVRDHVDLQIAGWTMPVPWLQSVDGLAPLIMMPLVVLLWRRQAARGREPDDFRKLAFGCLVFGFATAWLAAGQLAAGADGRIPLAWPIVFHLASNVGWLFLAPTAMALFARAAPASVNALMVGVYYLSIFSGSLLSGRIGVLYERVEPQVFWLLHAAIVGGGGVLLLLLAPWFRRELGDRGGAARS